MVRRTATLLLILTLLLRGAVFPHSHAGTGISEPADHDRPHLHLPFGHHHEERHKHPHGDHHGHTHSHPHAHSDEGDDEDSLPHDPEVPPSPGEHDAGVVYFPDVGATTAARGAVACPSSSVQFAAEVAPVEPFVRRILA